MPMVVGQANRSRACAAGRRRPNEMRACVVRNNAVTCHAHVRNAVVLLPPLGFWLLAISSLLQ